jgi:hypothetical protein
MRRLYLLSSILLTLRVFAGESSTVEVVAKLDELKATLATEVTQALATNRYTASYTTVWRNFEDDAQAALCAALKKHIPGLTDKNFGTGQTGSEKNRLADLAIVCGRQTIEVSVKASRGGQNSENDMGTFREHPNRTKVFVASFTLWGRYADDGQTIKVDRVFFDRTYRFVGKSTLVDGVKYRKKDGNMRPKSWAMFESGEAYWNTEEEFEAAVKRSESYRAKELVQEHLADLSETEQRVLYEQLKKKFGN